MIDRIKDWFRPLKQTTFLATVIVLAFVFDYLKLFLNIIKLGHFNMEEIPGCLRIAAALGRVSLSIFVVYLIIQGIKKSNHDVALNNDNGIYHNHFYISYLFCRYMLGYNSCNMKLVPIPMQFKLVIKGVFQKYIYEEGVYDAPKKEKVQGKVRANALKDCTETINLVISDTYQIKKSQLPEKVEKYKNVKIDRSSDDHLRYNSQKLVDKVVTAVRNLPANVGTVNVFATTNPTNTFHIAKEAFSTGGRDNIKHLFVFQQERAGERHFSSKGIKIY